MPQHSALGKRLIEGAEAILAYQRGERDLRTHRLPLTAREAAVASPPRYDAARIRAVRGKLALSQRVFAEALNVSPATVSAWEQGVRVPAGPTLRLLEIAEEFPEVFTAKVHATASG
ncbi:MAG TPA: helix-turn-helix domain-containing protein [Thermomicrobiales bacterium]|nr:helix-turn-helix domain-containing protein [Thermomicrobiales bacterium]